VQNYLDQNGKTVREYRPPATVFAQASLDSLGSIPVTEGHPPSGVNPHNHREHSVGHVSDAAPSRHKEGTTEWIEATLVISDAATLRKIDSGELTEVSMGYEADVVQEPGVTPEGEPFDAWHKSVVFNHSALLEHGFARAGRGASLRLDGNQEPIMLVRADDNTTPVATSAAHRPRVKVDGIECEQGSDTHIQMLERRITTETKRADDLTTALTTAQTELGAAKATIAAYKPVDVNALVLDELTFRQSVLPALPKAADGKLYDFTGKTREQVRADAVGAAVMADAAKLGSDAERAGYVQAHLKLKLDAVGKGPTALHLPSVVVTDATDPTKKRVDKRADAYSTSWSK
jgi:hypothetical protein